MTSAAGSLGSVCPLLLSLFASLLSGHGGHLSLVFLDELVGVRLFCAFCLFHLHYVSFFKKKITIFNTLCIIICKVVSRDIDKKDSFLQETDNSTKFSFQWAKSKFLFVHHVPENLWREAQRCTRVCALARESVQCACPTCLAGANLKPTWDREVGGNRKTFQAHFCEWRRDEKHDSSWSTLVWFYLSSSPG